jgi:3,4-dihydroxy 2-butanone 4-phosphate synthase/GTP cyclohydrolase II
MARRPDLVAFAQAHGLKIATIADLIAYRRRYDRIVERKAETEFVSNAGGAWRMFVYVNGVSDVEHVALVQGDISTPEPVLVRMHALNIFDDAMANRTSGRGGLLTSAMETIAARGRGVVVLLRDPSPTTVSDWVNGLNDQGVPSHELRDYGVGAQILHDLGVRDMILLSNTERTIIGLDGYGLHVVERRPFTGTAR